MDMLGSVLIPKLCLCLHWCFVWIFLQILRIFSHDLTDMCSPSSTPTNYSITTLTWVMPTRISRLTLPPPLIISPAAELFRKPVPPLRKPVARMFNTSSSFHCLLLEPTATRFTEHRIRQHSCIFRELIAIKVMHSYCIDIYLTV